jgi:hypothetical protein
MLNGNKIQHTHMWCNIFIRFDAIDDMFVFQAHNYDNNDDNILQLFF